MRRVNTLIIGSGAAGLTAAQRLNTLGVKEILVVSEGLHCGTSINTGSDKQTYYKLGIYGEEPDSPQMLAQTLFNGGSVHGDVALVEAALSVRCFSNLVNLGVPFPADAFGQYIGYKTDHDPKRRATSCGPYTSKEMCLSLIEAIRKAGVIVEEKRTVGELITVNNRAVGALIYVSDTKSWEAILAENIVFAVGGPGGLYAQSVYPCGHTGAIGLALLKGARGQGLPESQFGLASTKFRWNVSGTYMQSLPRFISTAVDGSDEKEFLNDYFKNDYGKLNSLVFLKGYQWPFDVTKMEEGSSIIDLLVYEETVVKKRRVFLDFRKNPKNLDFKRLTDEAYNYLKRSEALLISPVERLKKMNPGAIELYKEHNIDLFSEPLEIAVCAQHNNGGLTGNIWYESPDISRLFPVGEVNGSHGVTRPGGSALNAGQVGAFRCAEYIANSPQQKKFPEIEAVKNAETALELMNEFLSGKRDWRLDRKELQCRMTRYAGHQRKTNEISNAVIEAKALYQSIQKEGYPKEAGEQGIINRHLAFAHWGYLSAIEYQMLSNVGSRGSAAVFDENGKIVHECVGFRKLILETKFEHGEFHHRWVACRPIPVTDGWFENIWADFRNGVIYSK